MKCLFRPIDTSFRCTAITAGVGDEQSSPELTNLCVISEDYLNTNSTNFAVHLRIVHNRNKQRKCVGMSVPPDTRIISKLTEQILTKFGIWGGGVYNKMSLIFYGREVHTTFW
jgi:hypothetical protein